jgi:RHS repeat-associated protein
MCKWSVVPVAYSTGKERDAESGNDYFGARYYASTMGRFLSPDWAAAPMPVPFAKLNNPQTLNLYAYVGNNPLNGIDPDGGWHTLDFPPMRVPYPSLFSGEGWDSTIPNPPHSTKHRIGLPNSEH